MAAFLIAKIKGDGVFLEAFRSLLNVRFDLSRASTKTGDTFISLVCQSEHITVQKMQAVLSTKPKISPDMVQQLKSNIEKRRKN